MRLYPDEDEKYIARQALWLASRSDGDYAFDKIRCSSCHKGKYGSLSDYMILVDGLRRLPLLRNPMQTSAALCEPPSYDGDIRPPIFQTRFPDMFPWI
jgi:hypothetical protein